MYGVSSLVIDAIQVLEFLLFKLALSGFIWLAIIADVGHLSIAKDTVYKLKYLFGVRQ